MSAPHHSVAAGRPVLTNPPTPEKHLQVNLDALKRARDEGRAAGGGSPRWVKAASLLMDAFPALYDTAQRMNADAQAMREDLAQLRRQTAELQGQRGVLLGWISAVLPALEVVDALEDFEDGGQALQALRNAGQQLVSTPVRCATCDVPNGCPEFCKCLPVALMLHGDGPAHCYWIEDATGMHIAHADHLVHEAQPRQLETLKRMVGAYNAMYATAALQPPDPSPNCRACPGDGSVCSSTCRLQAESPPAQAGQLLGLTRYAVTERMPDADTDVLIWDASSEHSQLGAYAGDDAEGPVWVNAQGEGVAGVTHWAEMP